MAHHILLLVNGDYVFEALKQQLDEIFSPALDVFRWSPGGPDYSGVSFDVAVSTTVEIYNEALAKGIIGPGTPHFVMGRTLNRAGFLQLDQVFRLPPGARVAVCSNLMAGALMLREDLEAMGITHLDLVPYSPGGTADLSGVETALIFGFEDTAPPGMKTVLNLGPRVLDIQSILNMIQKAGIIETPADLSQQNFVRDVTVVGSRLALATRRYEVANQQLGVMLRLTADGVILLDEQLRIVQYNGGLRQAIGQIGHDISPGQPLQSVSGQLRTAVENAIAQSDGKRIGAIDGTDYLIEAHPVTVEERSGGYLVVLRKLHSIQSMEMAARKKLFEKNFTAKYTFDDIKTVDPSMERFKQFAQNIALSQENIAIYGESGTGKELFAQAIHNASNRADQVFVPVNVSALQDNLVESELFGYEEGAFTGARKGGKPGLFELAHNGTLFLDEIGDLSLPLQAKLLRAIQEREIVRVGGSRIIPVNLRLIVATNQNLIDLVRQGRFRQDLYYRVNVLSITLMPLRERRSDVELLLHYNLARRGTPVSSLPRRALDLLTAYDWPGNVRELENVCAYVSCLTSQLQIGPQEFYQKLCSYLHQIEPASPSAESQPFLDPNDRFLLDQLIAAQKQRHPLSILELHRRQKEAWGLSMAQLRQRLLQLAARGLIVIGQTRQGTRVTDEGLLLFGGETCRLP